MAHHNLVKTDGLKRLLHVVHFQLSSSPRHTQGQIDTLILQGRKIQRDLGQTPLHGLQG